MKGKDRNIFAQAFEGLQNTNTFLLALLQLCRKQKHFRSAFYKVAKAKNISALAFAGLQNIKTHMFSPSTTVQKRKTCVFWRCIIL